MLDLFEQQIIRSALIELDGDIKAKLSDPTAQAKVGMTSLLLAHLLARNNSPGSFPDIEQELKSLKQDEQGEQAILKHVAESRNTASPITADVLTTYLREKLQSPGLLVTEVNASLGGFSKQTYILHLTGGEAFGNRLVLRRDQDGGPVEVLAADEYRVIKSMHELGLPVAEPLVVDRAPPFGATAMVMRMVSGSSAFDVSGQHLGPEGKNAAMALARVLGKIHSAPLSALILAPEERGKTMGEHVHRMITLYEDQWKRRRMIESPTLAAAFAWLRSNIPDRGTAPTLVHGDASLRNLLIENGRESAMLDWELWHLGDHNEDLAYCKGEVEQVLPWESFMAEYQAHGGLSYDPLSASYYTVFTAVRNSVFAESCLHGFVAAKNPEGKFAYGALVLGRRLIYGMAEQFNSSAKSA